MSGFGERFRKAGYAVPKPLIEIEGKPIIAHVIDLFPGESDFLFICNQEHLDEPAYGMRRILSEHCPTGQVIGIPAHKRGPVHAVLQTASLIDPSRPVVVNYCDFSCYWDWPHFKRFVTDCRCDGAIPAYKGFHPHSLGNTNYAYMRESDGWVSDIQEKQPYTANRMDEYASSGAYYFASGALMLQAFSETVGRDLEINGEYYVSLAYKPLLEAGKRVAVYDLQHFMQWGTPQDVAEYQMWSDAFRRLADPGYSVQLSAGGLTLIPMAGLGERFSREGYAVTKPLIPVSGKPMVVQATGDLPLSDQYLFVLRRDMPGLEPIQETLRDSFSNVQTLVLETLTDGQARTALHGWQSDSTLEEAEGPLSIAACDNGALFQCALLQELLDDAATDVIVWVARGYPNAIRNPHMYGWVKCTDGLVTGVSVKSPLSDPSHDPIITGTFTFRHGADFQRSVERMIAREGRINGEYYIDSCIEDAIALGLTVRIFEIDSYLCWGTPNDLRTFEYWQSCFDKWDCHPYQLERDSRVMPEAVNLLRKRYAKTVPNSPTK